MSRKDAHAFAASLAATLMVSIVVFQAGDGTFGAVPADEIDGDEVQVLGDRSVGVMPTVVKRPGHGANTPPGLSPATVPPRQSNRTPPLVRGRLDLPDCPFRSD
jgi:hypothetical protein